MALMTFVAATLLVAFDQATKAWAQGILQPLGRIDTPLPGVDFVYVRNPGAAFGMFRDFAVPVGPVTVDGTFLLGVLSLAVSVWLVRLLARPAAPGRPALDRVTRVALTLILAGAVGNMIDRFRLGYVIDFVHVGFGAFAIPVFNVADAAISVGAAVLIVATVWPRRPEPRAGSAAVPPDPGAP